MKQTFIQRFQTENVDKVLSREQIAIALEEMAKDLRKPPIPDPDQKWTLAWGDVFEIIGHGGLIHGVIKLSINLP